MRRLFVASCALVFLSGCAKLQVHKVPLQCRLNGTDSEIKGFRYYLSRPYVIVKKPILVSEHVEHVVIAEPHAGENPPGGGAANGTSAARLRILDGPRRGQVVDGGEFLSHVTNRAGTQRLSDMESEGLRNLVANQTQGEGSSVKPASFPLPEVAELADTLPSGAGTPLPDQPREKLASADSNTALLEGDIQVVFLPDLDEQYAVHNKNIMAKSAFRLFFKDGWELTDVGAEHDSTTVAIEVLNLIDTAVNAAKTVGLAKIEQAAKLSKGGGTADFTARPLTIDKKTILQLVHATYIRPGIYRINKPWEMSEGSVQGEGLLLQLGLDVIDVTTVQQPSTVASLPTGGSNPGGGMGAVPSPRRISTLDDKFVRLPPM